MRIDRFALTTALAVVLSAGACAFASASGFPVYPGAVPVPPVQAATYCGHAVTEEKYTAGNTPSATIANWYSQRVPSGTRFSQNDGGGDIHQVVFDATGSHAANASYINNQNPNLPAVLRRPPSSFVLVTYSPPLGAAYVALLKQASTGNTAAIAAAKKKCPAS
jgi:hypothetical protein